MAKGRLRVLVASGRAVPFASRQYALGHACDQPRKWLGTRRVYETAYRLGCEPYLLLSRRHAPPYPEDFVGYGKDRVAYTYELAARGARLAAARPSLNGTAVGCLRHALGVRFQIERGARRSPRGPNHARSQIAHARTRALRQNA